jgi:hypothetical protein
MMAEGKGGLYITFGYSHRDVLEIVVANVIAISSRMQAVPCPHVSLDQRFGRVGIMGLFWISIKFLAWGLGGHRATPSEPEEAGISPASGLSLNRPLREIGAGGFARPAGSLAPIGSEDEDDGFSWEEEGANDERLRRSFGFVLRFGQRMDKVGLQSGTDGIVSF